jgi:hypothetical protein
MPFIREWSPDYLVNKDSPPIYFENNIGLTRPANIPEMPYKVHCPLWGIGFQKLAQAQGATCYLRYPGHESAKYKDMWDFLVEELTAPAT